MNVKLRSIKYWGYVFCSAEYIGAARQYQSAEH